MKVSRIASNNLADLFASVLCDGLDHLARKGLQQGYSVREEALGSIRGRVDFIASARKMLIQHGRAICRFNDLTSDTVANQTIKATIRALIPAIEDGELRGRAQRILLGLGGIKNTRLSKQTFRAIQLSSNERFYRFMIHVCEFVFGTWLVDSRSGDFVFRDFLREERAMARVFESFLFNFLRLELKGCQVSREHIDWNASSSSDPTLTLLPRMATDVVVRHMEHCRVADAKYYSEGTSKYFGTEKLHSQNLYQMMSYLTNLQAAEPTSVVSGLLIYPRVDRTLRQSYVIQGHRIDICTIDLNVEWREIRQELLSIFQR